jgi:hypothetical protein
MNAQLDAQTILGGTTVMKFLILIISPIWIDASRLPRGLATMA